MGGDGLVPLETWFWEMPICTRWWTTATVLMSGLVQCQVLTPFQLFYSYRTVFMKSEVSSHHFSGRPKCSPALLIYARSTGAS
jgi:hypothetical protein